MDLKIHRLAGRHRIAKEDVRHAVANYSVAAQVDHTSARGTLYLGPDRAGNLLEVFVLERDDGDNLAIHAMTMRSGYHPLLKAAGDRE